jgi:prokaryotic YEATS domain
VKTDGDQARGLAEDFLAEMSTAKVTEMREKGLTRFTILSENCQGHALIENRKGRLIYFSMFPKPKAVPSNMNRRQMQQYYPEPQPRNLRFEGNMARARPVPSRAAPRLKADNIAEQVGSDRWNWTVFLKGNRQDIDAIKCVQYKLHPSFPNPVKLVCKAGDPDRAFKFSASGWGTFTIDIRLFMKDGSHKDLKHRLKF